jgi:hypothetical protein
LEFSSQNIDESAHFDTRTSDGKTPEVNKVKGYPERKNTIKGATY